MANIKIVPNNEPDADGQWVTVNYGDDTMEKIKLAAGWFNVWKIFEGVIPDGNHIVQIELNAKLIFNIQGRELRMV